MLLEWIAQYGPWVWIGLGLALLALEILAPGVYLLWIGIAAILTGTLSFQLDGSAWWTWQVQIVTFLVLSVVAALTARRLFPANAASGDQPLLNRRDLQLVGRVVTLEDPIVNGSGRARIGDALWIVHGPDLPQGTQVRIVSADDGRLMVDRA